MGIQRQLLLPSYMPMYLFQVPQCGSSLVIEGKEKTKGAESEILTYLSILLLAERRERAHVVRRHRVEDGAVLFHGTKEYMDCEVTAEDVLLHPEVDEPLQVLVRRR